MSIDRNTLIGERVRFYRTARKMSMRELGEKFTRSVSAQQIAQYETGQARWSADMLVEIALLFGLDIRLLTGLESGAHEGKSDDEWSAERYKCILLALPSRARALIYRIIDDVAKFTNTSDEVMTGAEQRRISQPLPKPLKE